MAQRKREYSTLLEGMKRKRERRRKRANCNDVAHLKLDPASRRDVTTKKRVLHRIGAGRLVAGCIQKKGPHENAARSNKSAGRF
ncbi:hypothetical protein ALC62_07847 [Cyphomyrmex costatus]|uniref:Uncharacterized protein n=1 Tax=Cyphomyrmex costatus TaxID=456900 RepID=A0A195CKJ4_9HYME|nr:hypothetical protein ALC62_07847 [Cyphomyrmex costatus]